MFSLCQFLTGVALQQFLLKTCPEALTLSTSLNCAADLLRIDDLITPARRADHDELKQYLFVVLGLWLQRLPRENDADAHTPESQPSWNLSAPPGAINGVPGRVAHDASGAVELQFKLTKAALPIAIKRSLKAAFVDERHDLPMTWLQVQSKFGHLRELVTGAHRVPVIDV